MAAPSFIFPPLSDRFQTFAKVSFGVVSMRLHVSGPIKGGLPLITWQAGTHMDTADWRKLRFAVQLIACARDIEDDAAVMAVASYPRCAAVLDAALGAVVNAVRPVASIAPQAGGAQAGQRLVARPDGAAGAQS